MESFHKERLTRRGTTTKYVTNHEKKREKKSWKQKQLALAHKGISGKDNTAADIVCDVIIIK